MADLPVLVIVNGAAATGKTVLSKKLAKDLALPCLGKDDIKELLYDKMGIGDLKWAQNLGAGAADMLFVFIERWLELGRSMIAENAYYHRFAAPRFRALAEEGHALIIEVYCKTDPEVRRKRYMARGDAGEKHAGHVYREYAAIVETDEEVAAKYAPIGVGYIIEVDTTEFDTIDYSDIVRRIRTLIAKHQKEGNQ